jgi:ABC-type transport system involved in multi-copper enzyme maturation permease subunit
MPRGRRIDRSVVALVFGHALGSLVLSSGSYVVLSLSLATVLLVARNTLLTIRAGYLTVISDPFLTPLLAVSLLGGFFMALMASLSIARERELGILETLFYGPVSFLDYLLGKFLAHLVAYAGILTAFLLGTAGIAWLTHLALSPSIWPIVFLSASTVAALIGLGLLSAALMRTVRGAFLLLVGAGTVIVVLLAAHVVLTSIVSSRGYTGLITLRDAVAAINRVVTWLSPPSYLISGVDAALRRSWPEWTQNVFASILHAASSMTVSVILFRRKGVLR